MEAERMGGTFREMCPTSWGGGGGVKEEQFVLASCAGPFLRESGKSGEGGICRSNSPRRAGHSLRGNE